MDTSHFISSHIRRHAVFGWSMFPFFGFRCLQKYVFEISFSFLHGCGWRTPFAPFAWSNKIYTVNVYIRWILDTSRTVQKKRKKRSTKNSILNAWSKYIPRKKNLLSTICPAHIILKLLLQPIYTWKESSMYMIINSCICGESLPAPSGVTLSALSKFSKVHTTQEQRWEQ